MEFNHERKIRLNFADFPQTNHEKECKRLDYNPITNIVVKPKKKNITYKDFASFSIAMAKKLNNGND